MTWVFTGTRGVGSIADDTASGSANVLSLHEELETALVAAGVTDFLGCTVSAVDDLVAVDFDSNPSGTAQSTVISVSSAHTAPSVDTTGQRIFSPTGTETIVGPQHAEFIEVDCSAVGATETVTFEIHSWMSPRFTLVISEKDLLATVTFDFIEWPVRHAGIGTINVLTSTSGDGAYEFHRIDAQQLWHCVAVEGSLI